MTAKPKPTLSIVAADDGRLEVVRVRSTFRFLFADGATVDVVTDRDGSDVREAVLAYTGQQRIEGVAQLPVQASLL